MDVLSVKECGSFVGMQNFPLYKSETDRRVERALDLNQCAVSTFLLFKKLDFGKILPKQLFRQLETASHFAGFT